MARIVGVDLPKNKRGEVSLTYIYGIGRSRAQQVAFTDVFSLAQPGASRPTRLTKVSEGPYEHLSPSSLEAFALARPTRARFS